MRKRVSDFDNIEQAMAYATRMLDKMERESEAKRNLRRVERERECNELENKLRDELDVEVEVSHECGKLVVWFVSHVVSINGDEEDYFTFSSDAYDEAENFVMTVKDELKEYEG